MGGKHKQEIVRVECSLVKNASIYQCCKEVLKNIFSYPENWIYCHFLLILDGRLKVSGIESRVYLV